MIVQKLKFCVSLMFLSELVVGWKLYNKTKSSIVGLLVMEI